MLPFADRKVTDTRLPALTPRADTGEQRAHGAVPQAGPRRCPGCHARGQAADLEVRVRPALAGRRDGADRAANRSSYRAVPTAFDQQTELVAEIMRRFLGIIGAAA